jgi:maleylacetoacetate isomerase
VRDGGEHLKPDYRAKNPQARVPALELASGQVIPQSPAILEYLEEIHPFPALLPGQPEERARIRAVCAIIGCDIHPLNNSSVLGWLRRNNDADEAAVNRWYAHWVTEGFCAVEALLASTSGPFAFGAEPTLADCYLIPQVFNARRFGVALDAFPRILAIDAHCATLPAFIAAAPDKQPDAG